MKFISSICEALQIDVTEDIWLIIDDKVYDVTDFLNENPAFEDIFIEAAKRDELNVNGSGDGSLDFNLKRIFWIKPDNKTDMSSIKKFTYAEVKERCNGKDVWLIINDKVYDVTKFLKEHPGGEEVLVDAAGKDATKDFSDVGHSEAAIEQMASYLVGEIVDSEKKTKQGCPKNVVVGISSAAAVALGAYILYRGYKYFKSS